jgi:SAM-dependent methyltransferase
LQLFELFVNSRLSKISEELEIMKHDKVVFPQSDEQLDQDEEYFELGLENKEKIFFHDYRKIYKVPGLYEQVFAKHLKCESPKVISDLLYKNVKSSDQNPSELRILDFGAGNGMVADELNDQDPELIVGVDILEEAKEAAERDRKGLYRDYLVTDMAKPSEDEMSRLSSFKFNTLVTVAALGFEHIRPVGFINAFNLLPSGGWVAFNLRDRFLSDSDDSGFQQALNKDGKEALEVLDQKRYVHRLSVKGEPIHYQAIVGRKLGDIGG